MKTKQEIRQYITSIFTNINREELTTQSRNIGDKIIRNIGSKDIQHICIYENMSDEVETGLLIKKLKKLGYKIYTPQIISEIEMIFIDSECNIYEKEIDLFIVPGRAFTKTGKRLGRGKGYYDRIFSKKLYKNSYKLGICYDFQILDELSTEKHDIDMDFIITN